MTLPTVHAYRSGIKESWRPNPSQVVLIAFTAIIALGAALLSLPISHAGAPHSWVDDLFTSASAVCVTGLVTLDPGTSYSLFGQIVIMLLIQIGGLGYMTLFTISLLLVGKQLSMRDRVALQEATDQPGMAGLVTYFKNIVIFTLAIEAIGFALLALHTVPELGWGRGLYMALFHSVSAFNNAGFSLFSEGAVHWQGQGTALVVLCGLVIIGGLGYTVNQELMNRYLFKRQPNHKWDILLKLVLLMTACLIVVGTLLIWYFESNNPRTIAGLPWHSQLANSFFMAVQPRTAGFNSLDVGAYDRPTLMLTMVLMFIGAGPGGTAGGIKLTTVAIIVSAIIAAAQGRNDVPLFNMKRTVSGKQVLKAFTVMTLSLVTVVVTTLVLGSVDRHAFLPIMFEAISAFATVGLSTGITGQLNDAGKLILVGTMLVGRVGVLVIILSVITQRRQSTIHYMEEPLLVG